MSKKESPAAHKNNTGMSEYLFKESIKAMRPSGVLGSCKRGKGRSGANYLYKHTANGRGREKSQILTTRGLSKAGRNQEV